MTKLIDRLLLRPATVSDAPILEEWDRQPHVIAATSDDPAASTASGGADWRDELALTTPDYQYYIAEIDGRPIGAMLVIDPHTEATQYWGAIEPDLRAIDIWIGMADDLGKGYGEAMMRRALQLCFADARVTAVVIDPLSSNLRAHRFYRRLGFTPEGRRKFGDDDCLVHRLLRSTWKTQFAAD